MDPSLLHIKMTTTAAAFSACAPASTSTADVAPASAANASEVAVLFSGWLAVRVPKRGALARRHLVDVLRADVLLAGTFLPE